MKNSAVVACDTGPIIALINRRDRFHRSCVAALSEIRLPMWTVWPVISEAYHLLESHRGPGDPVFHWIVSGHIRLIDLRPVDIRRMRQLLKKYADLPMDLADAALLVACERKKINRVFTIDKRDFLIYRPVHTAQFEILP